MKQSLVELFSKIGNFSGIDSGANDKNSTHHYLETYDKLFEPFRNSCTILEIGLATGDSIKLWDMYFTNSNIVGVDVSVIFNALPYVPNNNTKDIIQADATKPEFLERIKDYTFDLVIDDGSHLTQHQVTTFNLLKDKMKKGGVYIIEDLLALDVERETYLALHPSAEIIDLRHVKGRFDDALVVIKF